MPRTLSSKFGPAPSVLADRIIAERQRLKLTQEQAAEGLGICRGSYKRLEITANPQVSTMLGLVALGMDPRALLPELYS